MPKSRPPYAPEFRQRIVGLMRKGRTPEELARQFEPSAQAIRNWVKQAALDAGERTDGLTTEERDEPGTADYDMLDQPKQSLDRLAVRYRSERSPYFKPCTGGIFAEMRATV
jgi:transposase